MVLKILGGSRGCDAGIIDIARALRYAADNGASVMNHSWGCDTRYSSCPSLETLNEAIRYTEARGVLFVQAAGNDWGNNNDEQSVDFWDDDFASGIYVAAAGRYDNSAGFSSIGNEC